MHSLVIFKTNDYKDKILNAIQNSTQLIQGIQDIQKTSNSIIIPNTLKIDYTSNLKCYCYDLYTTEKIITSTMRIDEQYITFPIESIVMETKVLNYDFISKDLMYNTIYNNPNDTRFILQQEHITIDVNIRNDVALLKITLDDIKLVNNTQSERISERPLAYLESLDKYFDLGIYTLTPYLEYLHYYKLLRSNTGYKKYSDFMNYTSLQFDYYNREYTANLNNGTLKFKLDNISDKYPTEIIFQTTDETDFKYIKELKKYFNINQLSLIANIKDLKLSTQDLYKMNFNKEDDFFHFSNNKNDLHIKYNIFSNALTVEQKFSIINDDFSNINKNRVLEYIKDIGDFDEICRHYI